MIADSTSRWAEALREFASRTGRAAGRGGLPGRPGLGAGRLLRAGRRGRRPSAAPTGSVTVIGAVSPPGGDMTEPVTAHTQRFVRSLWTLDRDLAYARHYPAVSWAGSFSRDADALGAWHARARATRPGPRRRARVAGAARRGRPAGRRWPSWSAPAACPATSGWCCWPAGCCARACCSRARCRPTTRTARAAKTAALVDAVLAVVDRCRGAGRAGGVPAATVEEVDFAPAAAGPGGASAPTTRRRRGAPARRRRSTRLREQLVDEPARAAVEYAGVAELRGPLLVVARGRAASAGTSSRRSGCPSGERAARPGPRGRPRPRRRAGARGHRRASSRPAPGCLRRGAAADPGRRRAGSAGSATAAASRSTAGRRSSAPRRAPVAGAPLNPTRREPPAEPVLTGVSAIDALTTLVRGQKLPIFSVGRAAAPGAGHPDRRAGHGRRRAVLRGLRRAWA